MLVSGASGSGFESQARRFFLFASHWPGIFVLKGVSIISLYTFMMKLLEGINPDALSAVFHPYIDYVRRVPPLRVTRTGTREPRSTLTEPWLSLGQVLQPQTFPLRQRRMLKLRTLPPMQSLLSLFAPSQTFWLLEAGTTMSAASVLFVHICPLMTLIGANI